MFYKRIKDLREDNDKKQSEIAKYLEITQQQYSMYERGDREIKVHQLIKLANLYKVSLDYITGRTNDKRGIGYADSFRDGINITQQNSSGDNNVTIKK